MSWYEAYGERHGGDGAEGRLVALFRFDAPWTSWEMHPAGDEVVCCIQGHMTLHQELPDGSKQPLTNLHVRATEYTVGPNGLQAMPADFAPSETDAPAP